MGSRVYSNHVAMQETLILPLANWKLDISFIKLWRQSLYFIHSYTNGNRSSGIKLMHTISSVTTHQNHYFVAICHLLNALPIIILNLSVHIIYVLCWVSTVFRFVRSLQSLRHCAAPWLDFFFTYTHARTHPTTPPVVHHILYIARSYIFPI